MTSFQSPSVLELLIYFAAFTSSFVAFSMQSIYWLRVFTVTSSALYAVYYFNISDGKMLIDITTESILVGVNLTMLLILIYRQSLTKLSDDEKRIYKSSFKNLSPLEFYQLIKIAKWTDYSKGQQLATYGEKLNSLYYIFDGEVDVKREATLATLGEGCFAGELSFHLDIPASADLFIKKKSKILVWPQDELHELMKKKETIKNTLFAAISADLARKLLNRNEETLQNLHKNLNKLVE